MNTVIISLASSALALILGSAAAYALTHFVFHPKVGAVLVFVE
jgi:ABC-type glycerol-3-phosphate transport system permease component